MEQPDDRVYYGEYSLKRWIDLMLSKNIRLPDYQRHFVWLERDVKRLIKSIKERQFVQPVTIALYDVEGQRYNLILDGQQRLTSILLAYLGYIPDRKKFLEGGVAADLTAPEDDSASDEPDDTPQSQPILWKFSDLLHSEHNDKESTIQRISNDSRYIKLTDKEFTDLTDDFFENSFIGFSYIVPASKDPAVVQTMFSKLFRNINYFGKKLDPIESRKSLYFQNKQLVNYFEGTNKDNQDVLCGIKIMENLQPYRIDFVRYLSILSQYMANDANEKKVLVGYSAFGSRESLYADYVSYVLRQGPDEQESRPDKFSRFNFKETFPYNCWEDRFDKLKAAIERLKDTMGLNAKGSFTTWMEADYWLFGLIYHIVFRDKTLKESLTRDISPAGTTTLQNEIDSRIKAIKSGSADYMKNVNRLGNLRERLKESCEIYEHYLQ